MLDFRVMISPTIIRGLFVIGIVASVIGAALLIGLGIRHHRNAEVFVGVGTFFVGPLAVRLVCEQLILFFQINETLNNLYLLVYNAVEEHGELGLNDETAPSR